MFDPGIERTVSVWGKPHKVTVYRKSKTVYTVTGDYMGRLIEGKASSHRSALRAWADAARYLGNHGPINR